jgi:hypothetical protein
MSLVTALTVTPSRLTALLETCMVVGGRAPRMDVEGLISPPVLRRGADPEEAKVDELLREAQRLGLAVLDGPEIVLTTDGTDASRDLRSWLWPRLLSDEDATALSQEEFPLLLCWLLMQDPYEGLDWAEGPDTVKAVFGDAASTRETLRNKSVFQQFLYWARYLGFVTWVKTNQGTRVVPLPTAALERVLDDPSLGPGYRGTADGFVRRVGELCPVLESGKVRERVESGSSFRSYDLTSAVSPSLGLALLTLEARGRIQLMLESDSRTTLSLVPRGRGSRQFTHTKVA